MAADNKMLGQFDLIGIPPAPRGVPQIEVSFDIDANGIVNVGASDKGTGKVQNITIQSGGGLSDADVERMVNEAEKHREADETKRGAVSAKNDAENLCYTVEKQMSDMADKVTSEDKTDLKDKIEKLRQAMGTDDLDQIKEAHKNLQEASWKVSQRAYQTGGDGGADNNSSEGSTEDQQKESK